MSKKKSIIITLIIVGIILLLLLLWGFAVPHYDCKQKCDFKFWGKYYSKATCKKKCTLNNNLGSTLGSQNKRHFCTNVNHTNTNGELYNYRICTPCKDNTDYQYGIKYEFGDNNEIINVPCTLNNSYSSYEECKSCQTSSNLNHPYCSDRNITCTQSVNYQDVNDYLTYTTPLYYTSPYCDYCSYNTCTNCQIPCTNCCPTCPPSSSPPSSSPSLPSKPSPTPSLPSKTKSDN